MATALALAAAGLTALALVASSGRTTGGYAEFFAVLTAAALVVALAGRYPGSSAHDRAAKVVAVAWDATVLYAAGLLVYFDQLRSSPTPGPPVLFLGVPIVVYHVLAAYGGAVLVSVASFGPSRRSVAARTT